MSESRADLLRRVFEFAARDGLADRSLRDIAKGVGTSHRMLIYHFQSREGLLAAVVGAMEAQQRATMTALAAEPGMTPIELMTRFWGQLGQADVLPYVRLFFEVFALASRNVPGTEQVFAALTTSWLEEGAAVSRALGVESDPAAIRLGVAVSRGLLLDRLAGASEEEVNAAYDLFLRSSALS